MNDFSAAGLRDAYVVGHKKREHLFIFSAGNDPNI
jgi:hypothetical protein